MKKVLLAIMTVAVTGMMTSCIEEIDPQNSTVTFDQAANAPGSYNNFVNTITSSLCGQFIYGGADNKYPFDFGYPSFFLQRDAMGQDIVTAGGNNWFSTYYESFAGLAPTTARCQVPWTLYYNWIKNCNTVIGMAGPDPDATHIHGAGIAHAMRAMFYLDLARQYSPSPYAKDKNAETVPIIKESTTISDAQNNPRATNEAMYAFILEDLTMAEEQIAGYERSDVYTPDITVVYGLKARTYLEMEDWANAEKYAKMAQQGYTMMDEAAYTDRETGFNKPNAAWMFAVVFKSDDPNILVNDADSSWGSQMIIEINHDPKVSGCGYAANYGDPNVIDRHLYETIPATDWRKKCYVDFAIDELPTKAAILEALKDYTDYPATVFNCGVVASDYGQVGGLELKFRPNGGADGYNNQYIGFCVSVPLMRVEEMKLIEAEAAGMQDVARGIELLTAFAKTRDAAYEYGTHQDAYGNTSTSVFQNEVWWQRRVELWGEGFATFDIKRLQKGIIRSYAGSNHLADCRFNTATTPQWMTWPIIQTETNYNNACTNNPVATRPDGDSPEYVW